MGTAPFPGSSTASVHGRHGTLTVHDGQSGTFGRAAENDLRIGHAPQFDRLVPRRAGELALISDRLFITNRGDQLAFLVRVPGRSPVVVSPDDSYGPGASDFEIVFEGEYRHTLRVELRVTAEKRTPTSDDSLDTHRCLPELTDRQRQMLDLFVEPLMNGGACALTHQQVADRLQVSRGTVRVDMSAIWNAFEQASVPMRPHHDRRDEVLDAWLRHRLAPAAG